MEILVDRFIADSDSTISKVSVDNRFVSFGLEDEFREEKIVGQTRIPAGNYRITLRTEGGFHERYNKRFKEFHRGMLHIRNVPNFQFILIHFGNTDEDTKGCLLVGSQAITAPGDMMVTQSAVAYRRFYPMVVDAAERDDLAITFIDNDR